MSVQENVLQRGSSLTYPSTKPIASKSHMEVQVHHTIDSTWAVVPIGDYDLITNSCVFNADFDLSDYDLVNVRVGDTPNDLATQPSDIADVVAIQDEIVIVAGISDEVVVVDNIADEVVAAAGMEVQIRDVTSEPLRQSILDGSVNAGRAEAAATASESSAVASEESHQRTLLVEPEVVAQGDAQDARVIAEGDTQDARVIAEGDTQDARVLAQGDIQDTRVSDEGDTQVNRVVTIGDQYVADIAADGDTELARIRAVGDVQDARVINEGDTQVARLIADVDVAEDHKGWADANARQADAWANTPVNQDVTRFTWDEINDVIVEAPMVGERSALHWQTIAQTVASGLKFQGTWDAVDCSEPPLPAPPVGELANGYFYIITSTTGDTALCPNLSIGDWVVWSGDLAGDGAVEGGWVVVDWTFDWSAITGVPENVSNALSRAGGTMTAPALVSYDASAPAANEYVARSYIDALAALFMPVNAGVPFTAVPRTSAAQGTDVSELTRKDYVDTKLPKAGGTMTGELTLENVIKLRGEDPTGTPINIAHVDASSQVQFGQSGSVALGLGDWAFINACPKSSIAPTTIDHLTRKDYVDAAISALNPVGSVVLRMDAINPATIYGGTWSLITGDASLSFGDGTAQDGVAAGENNPVVPLAEHSHANTATFSGDVLADHTHKVHTYGYSGSANEYGHSATTTVCSGGIQTDISGNDTDAALAKSAGTPSGSVTMTNANAGTAGATLDVRGSRISINVWRRLS